MKEIELLKENLDVCGLDYFYDEKNEEIIIFDSENRALISCEYDKEDEVYVMYGGYTYEEFLDGETVNYFEDVFEVCDRIDRCLETETMMCFDYLWDDPDFELSEIDLMNLTDDEEIMDIISEYPEAFIYIKNPSELIQLEAIERNPGLYIFIKNPNDAVTMELLNLDPYNINLVENPSENIKEYHNVLCEVRNLNIEHTFLEMAFNDYLKEIFETAGVNKEVLSKELELYEKLSPESRTVLLETSKNKDIITDIFRRLDTLNEIVNEYNECVDRKNELSEKILEESSDCKIELLENAEESLDKNEA